MTSYIGETYKGRLARNERNRPQQRATGCFPIAIHRKFQTRRVAEDSTRLYGTDFPKSLFKIPVIRTNLNGCAELSPPPQGEARSGRVPTQNASAFCVGLEGGLGAVYISTLPRCGLCSAVIHQTAPSPVGEGRGGGSKSSALATVSKTNCKHALARSATGTARALARETAR